MMKTLECACELTICVSEALPTPYKWRDRDRETECQTTRENTMYNARLITSLCKNSLRALRPPVTLTEAKIPPPHPTPHFHRDPRTHILSSNEKLV